MELKKLNEPKLYHVIVPISGTAIFDIMAETPEEIYTKLEEDETLESAKYDISNLDIESAIVFVVPNKIKS